MRMGPLVQGLSLYCVRVDESEERCFMVDLTEGVNIQETEHLCSKCVRVCKGHSVWVESILMCDCGHKCLRS